MSSPDSTATKPWYDISTRDSRRQTLRTLIKAVIVLTALWGISDVLWPMPEPFERAFNQQWESMPTRRFWIGTTIGVGLIGLGLAGLWKLWNYRSEGVVFLAIYAFFPPAMAMPITVALTSASAYFGSLADIAIGMILFLCWTQPDVFEPEASTTDAGIHTPT